ncbi:MAG: peptidoglycan-associated lipoprotein Pal, partial [Deltaproteobacteria bacterium]|nr:peptidoglycan-associated lipoprotein Pal [Deltaproteobacteria bacterium]
AQINTTGFQEIDADATELKNVFTDITFDYDDFSLKPSAKETLKTIAEWLLKNTGKQILVEGHCDERGTNEYNLALGERRANSAKKYLVQLGVSPKRIATISYGEERPVAPGNNEDAWAKNRRDHFLLR